MYTSKFNHIFAELMVNDKEEFRPYLTINTASHQVSFVQKISLFIEKLRKKNMNYSKDIDVIPKEATGGIFEKVLLKITVLKVSR